MIRIWKVIPIKYLDKRFFVVSSTFSNLLSSPFGATATIILLIKSLSFKKKKVIKITEKASISAIPNTERESPNIREKFLLLTSRTVSFRYCSRNGIFRKPKDSASNLIWYTIASSNWSRCAKLPNILKGWFKTSEIKRLINAIKTKIKLQIVKTEAIEFGIFSRSCIRFINGLPIIASTKAIARYAKIDRISQRKYKARQIRTKMPTAHKIP